MSAKDPSIEPFDQGMLDVGDGHSLHWEVSGNPEGKPAVALHGGPGSASSSGRRRSFDHEVYRLVQFDQRGCGLSTPGAADVTTDLYTNTTHHLIKDIERLRAHLGIDRWLVWGGSWGATLGLAYAERYPQRVTEMVLVAVTISRRSDIHWLYCDVGRLLPEEWMRFREGGGNAEDLVAAYDRLLNAHPDPAVRGRAAQDWCAWEDAVVSLDDGWAPSPRFADPDYRMAFARLCSHYFAHRAWLDEGELLNNASSLSGIPAVLIHGRRDLGAPADVPWLLSRAWPDADLQLVDTGHSGGAAMTEAMVAALDRFAQQ